MSLVQPNHWYLCWFLALNKKKRTIKENPLHLYLLKSESPRNASSLPWRQQTPRQPGSYKSDSRRSHSGSIPGSTTPSGIFYHFPELSHNWLPHYLNTREWGLSKQSIKKPGSLQNTKPWPGNLPFPLALAVWADKFPFHTSFRAGIVTTAPSGLTSPASAFEVHIVRHACRRVDFSTSFGDILHGLISALSF